MKSNVSGVLGYPTAGDNRISRIDYSDGSIHINEAQSFVGCSQEIWDFSIGSYRVLEKWLKSRKGKILTSTDIETFSKIATIIKATLEIQKELDFLLHKI